MADVDTRLLPHAIQKALNELGIAMPWDEIARQLKNGQSGGAVAQHLAKDCTALKEDGIKVPSPLKRGGNRAGRHEPVSITRLAPAASKVSKASVNNLSQRANDKRARKNFKKKPSHSVQRDSTPPPHPRKKGQYTLACAPVARITPAFAQRELRPHPPPFFEASAPAVSGPPPSPPFRGPSNHPPPPSSLGHSAPAVIDLYDSETVQEDTDGSDSGSEHDTMHPSMPEPQAITDNEPAQEAVNHSVTEHTHESSSILPEHEEQFQPFGPEPETDFSFSNYLGQTQSSALNTSWPAANPNNAMLAPGLNPYNFNFADQTIDPAAFLENELSMVFQDRAASMF